MCMTSVTVEIEFATDGWGVQSQSPPPLGRLIRLVESRTGGARTLTLTDGSRPARTLTEGEAGELLGLLDKMAVAAPWKALAGFDGCTYTLNLVGPMSGMTFRWWVEVPEGWESIGAVLDFVVRLADRLDVD